VREEKSVAIEGENARAVWSPDTKTVAVLVSVDFFSCLPTRLVLIETIWFAILMLNLLVLLIEFNTAN
jgi:hypothetical protein